jgi:FMN phosphatase YigB (HAD superfamily)
VDRGVRLSLGGTIYDPTDPLGKMFFNILATFAEFEVDLLRLRTREGMPSPARRASRAASSRSTPPGSNASWYGCTTPASTPRPTSRAVHRLPSHRVPGPRTPPRHRSLNRRGTPIVVFALEATATPIGTVTNCSDELGRQAAELVGVPFEVTVTAQSAGVYKPQPEPYRQALDALALPAERVLFVAGSPYDIPGAGRLGMDVWWHNRVGMPSRPGPRPVAEHRSLGPLPGLPAQRPEAARAGAHNIIPTTTRGRRGRSNGLTKC